MASNSSQTDAGGFAEDTCTSFLTTTLATSYHTSTYVVPLTLSSAGGSPLQNIPTSSPVTIPLSTITASTIPTITASEPASTLDVILASSTSNSKKNRRQILSAEEDPSAVHIITDVHPVVFMTTLCSLPWSSSVPLLAAGVGTSSPTALGVSVSNTPSLVPNSDSGPSGIGQNLPALIGGLITVLVLVLAAALAMLFVFRRRRQQSEATRRRMLEAASADGRFRDDGSESGNGVTSVSPTNHISPTGQAAAKGWMMMKINASTATNLGRRPSSSSDRTLSRESLSGSSDTTETNDNPFEPSNRPRDPFADPRPPSHAPSSDDHSRRSFLSESTDAPSYITGDDANYMLPRPLSQSQPRPTPKRSSTLLSAPPLRPPQIGRYSPSLAMTEASCAATIDSHEQSIPSSPTSSSSCQNTTSAGHDAYSSLATTPTTADTHSGMRPGDASLMQHQAFLAQMAARNQEGKRLQDESKDAEGVDKKGELVERSKLPQK